MDAGGQRKGRGGTEEMRERERGRFSSLSFVFSSCFFFFPFPPLFFFPPFEIEKQHPLCYLQPFLYVFVSSANFNERRRGAERGGGGGTAGEEEKDEEEAFGASSAVKREKEQKKLCSQLLKGKEKRSQLWPFFSSLFIDAFRSLRLCSKTKNPTAYPKTGASNEAFVSAREF